MHPPATPAPSPHQPRDDAMALFNGAVFISLGILLFQQDQLLTGGTAGIAFLAHYLSGWPFGLWFFLVNLPFYWLAWRRLGAEFTFKTFAAVALISLFAEMTPRWIRIAGVEPFYAAIVGGCLIGCGLLILFRHKASLGGVGILALHLQASRGWSAGKFQMAVDCLIVGVALWVASPQRVGWSIVGAIVVNLVLAMNHKPGRYRGMS